MASAEPAGASLAMSPAGIPAVLLVSTEFTPALSPWASLGCTVLGAAFGGLLMFLAFQMVNWTAASKGTKDEADREPLLEKGDAASQDSTTCSSWHDDPSAEASAPKAEAPVSWTMLITTFLMALPSLLGTWCWPLLLVALFPATSGFETDTNREAFHHFTFGADIVLFGIVIWYMARMASRSQSAQLFTARWGPLIVASLGCALLMMDPTRHVLLDHGGVFFEEKTLAMYQGPGQLSAVGKFCQCASIAGFLLLIGGVVWHMRMPQALLAKFSGTELSKTL